jgi:hypothetical protein
MVRLETNIYVSSDESDQILTKSYNSQYNIDNQQEEHYADPTNKTFNPFSVKTIAGKQTLIISKY